MDNIISNDTTQSRCLLLNKSDPTEINTRVPHGVELILTAAIADEPA